MSSRKSRRGKPYCAYNRCPGPTLGISPAWLELPVDSRREFGSSMCHTEQKTGKRYRMGGHKNFEARQMELTENCPTSPIMNGHAGDFAAYACSIAVCPASLYLEPRQAAESGLWAGRPGFDP